MKLLSAVGADRAKNLILLSGLEPGKDIEIKFTALKQRRYSAGSTPLASDEARPSMTERRFFWISSMARRRKSKSACHNSES